MAKRILIFDDDKDILEVTAAILSKYNFEVKTINYLENGFLTNVRNFKPDVILMDLRIPEIGGMAATLQLKKTSDTKDIPVILFTAQNNGKETLEKSTGADDVVFKPFTISNLM